METAIKTRSCVDVGTRDLRIDFFRGLALLIIFSGHVRGNALLPFMPRSTGFSDTAEVFVFLSGYVCGIVYYRRFVEHGFFSCQVKSLIRCGQVYFAHLATSMLLVGLVAVFSCYYPNSFLLSGLKDFRLFLDAQLVTTWNVVTFREQFEFFGILPLYAVLLVLLPAMLAVFHRLPILMLGVSIGTYLGYHVFPRIMVVLDPWQGAWYFEPLAWQMLFFTAVYLGASGVGSPPKWTRRPGFIVLTLVALEVAFLIMVFLPGYEFPLIDKHRLGPLRVLHFAFIVVLVANFLPRESGFWQSSVARPVLLCGQNALIVYCAGAILSGAACLVLGTFGNSVGFQVAVNVGGWMGCLCAAWVWRRGQLTVLKMKSRVANSTATLSEAPDAAVLIASQQDIAANVAKLG